MLCGFKLILSPLLFHHRVIDEEALEQALSAAVTCTILAAAGPQRSRVLATLYKVMAFLVFFLMKKIKILQLKNKSSNQNIKNI